MAADAPDPRDAEVARLTADNARLRATVGELLGVVAGLREQVESQRARIEKLVKLTFGPRAERVARPAPPDDPRVNDPPTPAEPDAAMSGRRGYGRRALPADLPRERVEVDLSDAEKACPCCSSPRVRVAVVGPLVDEHTHESPPLAWYPTAADGRSLPGGSSATAANAASGTPPTRAGAPHTSATAACSVRTTAGATRFRSSYTGGRQPSPTTVF